MRFLKSNEIRLGMRLAKPIYNESGVLLYSRDTIINDSVLANIKNLHTYGQYILEPAEPLPPMTEEEIEFERFTTVSSYILKEDLLALINGEHTKNINSLANSICENYGNLSHKINFIQNLRNSEDGVFKHCLNTAILCALIAHKMDFDTKEQHSLVMAAFYHDLGKLLVAPEIMNKTDSLSVNELNIIHNAELKGFDLIKNNYSISAGIRRYIAQLYIDLCNRLPSHPKQSQTLLTGTKILKIADMFDTLTAMRVYKDPVSEFSAIKHLFSEENVYDEKIVQALAESINILPVGCCVELTNGEKGLVIDENKYYVLRPRVLAFNTNTIYDLGMKKTYQEIQIKDIMKTMDNRFVMKM